MEREEEVNRNEKRVFRMHVQAYIPRKRFNRIIPMVLELLRIVGIAFDSTRSNFANTLILVQPYVSTIYTRYFNIYTRHFGNYSIMSASAICQAQTSEMIRYYRNKHNISLKNSAEKYFLTNINNKYLSGI